MYPRLLLAVCIFSLNANAVPLIITEIMRNPAGLEDRMPGGKSDEYIEIVNMGSEPFLLDSFFLTDGDAVDSIVSLTTITAIPAGGVALIIDRDRGALSAHLQYSIDTNAVLLSTSDNSLGDGLSTTDGIALFKGTRKAIARLCAYAGNEQILELQLPLSLTLTVSPSEADGFSAVPYSLMSVAGGCKSTRASPGSVTGLVDGRYVEYIWGSVIGDTTIICTLSIMSAHAEVSVDLNIKNGNLPLQKHTLFMTNGQGQNTSLLPLNDLNPQVILNTSNGDAVWTLDLTPVWVPFHTLAITELFPRATSTTPEWIEVCNSSALAVSLAGWRLLVGDNATELSGTVAPFSRTLFSRDALLFCGVYPASCPRMHAVPAWYSLDNYRDTLTLVNTVGLAVDKLAYASSWFPIWNLSQSIQRLSSSHNGLEQDSWFVAQPTPAQNEQTLWRKATGSTLSIGPIPFSPNGDGRDDQLAIRITQRPGDNVSVSIFSFDGKERYTAPAITSPVLYWNGRTQSGVPLESGPFYVIATVKNQGATRHLRSGGVLWR